MSVEELLCRRSGGVCCHEDLACMLSRPRAALSLSVNYLPLLSWYPGDCLRPGEVQTSAIVPELQRLHPQTAELVLFSS